MTRLDPTFVAAQFYTSYQTPRVWVNDATQYGMDVLKNAEVRTGTQEGGFDDYHCLCGYVRFHLPCSPVHPLIPCDTREPPQTRVHSALNIMVKFAGFIRSRGNGGIVRKTCRKQMWQSCAKRHWRCLSWLSRQHG